MMLRVREHGIRLGEASLRGGRFVDLPRPSPQAGSVLQIVLAAARRRCSVVSQSMHLSVMD